MFLLIFFLLGGLCGTKTSAHIMICGKSLNSTQRGVTVSEDSAVLTAGQITQRKIRGGDRQFFTIAIKSGQYVRLVVHQHGIILRVSLFDPNGTELVVMNNPSGGYGPIYISEIAASPGTYRLEVCSTEDWANPGSFGVGIDELRVSNPEDSRRIAAERLFAKALKEDEARSFKSAIEDYRKALSDWQGIHDSHWEALTQYALGQTYRRSGNRKMAEECFLESLKIEVDENDWRLKASALNDLGFTKALKGDSQNAISLLTEALQLYEKHGDRRGQASSLNNLSITYGQMGELRKAGELAERALPLRQAENLQSGVNNLRNTLGNIHDRLGEPYKSLEYHNQALEGWLKLAEAKQLDGPDRLANAFNNVALANKSLGNWDKALQYYNEALRIPTTSAPVRAAILNNKGDLYASLGDFDAALTVLGEAGSLLNALENPNPDLKASVLFQIGQIHGATGKLADALQHFQQAKAIGPNDPKLAYILTALGDVWSRQGNFAESSKAYSDALKIQLKIEDRRGQAVTRQKLGETYALSGNPMAALKEYQSAVSLWRVILDRHGEAATLNRIALLERDRNNLGEALQRSEQATSILESLRVNVSSHKLRTTYFAQHENYYELDIDLKMMFSRDDRSGHYLAAALAASEKSRARSLIDTLAEARTDITEGVSDELLRLEREVDQKLRAKLEAQTLLLSAKHNQNEATAISQEVSDLVRQQDEIRGRIRAASPKYSQLTQPQLLNLAEIQQLLDDNTVLLEYALGDKRSYVWAVTPNSIKGFELAGREQIEAVARRATEALTARNRAEKMGSKLRVDRADQEFAEASAELSKMVLAPVASVLGEKRLVIVADGALHLVPFGALPSPDNSTVADNETPGVIRSKDNISNHGPARLIDHYEIISLPSASVLALQRRELANRKAAPLTLAVIADPVYNQTDFRLATVTKTRNNSNAVTTKGQKEVVPKQGVPGLTDVLPSVPNLSGSTGQSNEAFPLAKALRDVGIDGSLRRLPWSAEEARAIGKLVPRNQNFTSLGFKANRETATSAELSKYRYIHFATHGIMDLDHPELSGIVFSMFDEKGQPQDGYLRLHEIYNLNLPAELVVLSACQTGVGKQIKGEGLIALTRGFMYAGAKSIVASLWKVDDAATAELMEEFYKQMFTNKLKPSAALRAAQIKMSQKKHRNSPYYWAGFFLQGEWN